MKLKNIDITLYLAFLSMFISPAVFSCTRLLHVDPKQGVMVGRNMDWFEEMQTKLIVYPRGIARTGYEKINPLTWTSQYGSIVATSYDIGTADGMNEKGLAVHGLWLDATDYGQRNEKIPGLSLLVSVLYFLDNFKTVDEAIRATQSDFFQMLPFYLPNTGDWVKFHWALEDASGDSAIIEYINGQPKIYHDNNYSVLSNDQGNRMSDQKMPLNTFCAYSGCNAAL
jgi:choloylglycine hydrolase